jgi:hypothetical protein
MNYTMDCSNKNVIFLVGEGGHDTHYVLSVVD